MRCLQRCGKHTKVTGSASPVPRPLYCLARGLVHRASQHKSDPSPSRIAALGTRRQSQENESAGVDAEQANMLMGWAGRRGEDGGEPSSASPSSLPFLTVCSFSNSSPSMTALKLDLCSCPEYGLITRNLVLVFGASQRCSKPGLWVRSPYSFLWPGPLQSKWLFPHSHGCSHTWHHWQLLNPWNSSVWVLLKSTFSDYFLAIFPQAPLIALSLLYSLCLL